MQSMVFKQKYSRLVEIFKKMFKPRDKNENFHGIELLAQTLLETKVDELDFSTTKTIKGSFKKINTNEEFVYHFISSRILIWFPEAQFIPFEKYKTIKKRPLTIASVLSYSENRLDELYFKLIDNQKQLDFYISLSASKKNQETLLLEQHDEIIQGGEQDISSIDKQTEINLEEKDISNDLESEENQESSVSEITPGEDIRKRVSEINQDETNSKLFEDLSVANDCRVEELGNTQLAQLITGLFEKFEKNIEKNFNQKIDAVEKSIEKNFNQKIDAVEKNIEKNFNQKIEAVEKSINQKIDAVEKNIEKNIEKNFNQKIEAFEKSIEKNFNQKIDAVEKNIEKNINQKIDAVEKNIEKNIEKNFNQKIDAFEKNIIQKIDSVEKSVGDIKQSVDYIKKKVDYGFENIGSLYEINVLDFLKRKYINSSIRNPILLSPDFSLLDERVRKTWEGVLYDLVQKNKLTQKEANCLTLNTTGVECNFIITLKNNKVFIFEATMTLNNKNYLVRKLLQLERQIMAYKLINNGKPTKVGFVTPSNIEETKIADIAQMYSSVLTNIKSYLDEKCFKMEMCRSHFLNL